MRHPDAKRWDKRYRIEAERYKNRPVYPLVKQYADQLPPNGLVLDAAAGTSPAGLFLAERGHHVIAMDISEVGLRLAQSQVCQRGLPMSLAVMDMSMVFLPVEHFDVILNFYFLTRNLYERYRQALKPGGWLFFETFVKDPNQKGDCSHYLEYKELETEFQDWEIHHSLDIWKARRDGKPADKKISQLVARKNYS